MLATITRPESDTGAYVREQRERYAREYGCKRWVADARNPGQQLCRIPFTRGEPNWAAVSATLDSLLEHQPAPVRTEILRIRPTPDGAPPQAPPNRGNEGFVERLPVDRITQCFDGSWWEIIEWVAGRERRASPQLALPGCAPSTEAEKEYAQAGWRLYRSLMDAARLRE